MSVEIPGGTYLREYSDTGNTGEGAMVSPFRLDKYDVTVGRFRQFVKAVLPPDGGTGWLPPAGSGRHTHLNGGHGLVDIGAPLDAGTVYETGWAAAYDSNVAPTQANLACDAYATWTSAPGSDEQLPIDCVNWYEAYAFCIWDGGFLPSEAEWEFAAAGGNQQRAYPWGNMPPFAVNQYAIYNCLYPTGSVSCTGVSNVAPVGTPALGAGAWGQLDLAGNVSQWTLDSYGRYVPCVDCGNFSNGSRVIRGGAFDSDLSPPYRGVQGPTIRPSQVGFRCARVP